MTFPISRLSALSRGILAGTMFAGLTALALPAAFAGTPADTLVIANSIDDLKTMDPGESFEFAGQDIDNNVYETLITLDPQTLKPIPGIAKSWDVSEDGKTFTFKLATDHKFASGNPVRAEDVVWSLRRAVKLDKSPAFILTQFGFTKDNVERTIKSTADDTVELVTDKPYAPSFLYNALTSIVASVLDEKTVMANASGDDMGNEWLRLHSAGSGAYQVRSWKPNDSVILEANPNFNKPLAMKRVFIRHVAESATQRLLLENGDVDIARNLTPDDIKAISSNDKLKVFTQPRGRIYYICGNQLVEPLSKPKVMEAIKYLIDYDGMASSFLNGQVAKNQSFLPIGFLGYLDRQPYSLNVDKAKELLKEAGYPDGFSVELLVRNNQQRVDIAQSVQNTLAKAGIKVNIRQATGAEVLSAFRARKTELTLEAWGPDYPDPNTNASVFAENPDNSEKAQLTGNLSWRIAFAAKETTPMAEAAVVERDTEKREKMYQDMQKISQDSSPFVPMFQITEQDGMQKNIEGFSAGGAVGSAFFWPVKKGAQ